MDSFTQSTDADFHEWYTANMGDDDDIDLDQYEDMADAWQACRSHMTRRIAELEAEREGMVPRSCQWNRDSNPDYVVYNTGCDNAWVFDDHPSDDMNFCPGCGGKVVLTAAEGE